MKMRIIFVCILLLAGCVSNTYRGSAVRNRINDASELAAHDISIDERAPGVITLNGNVASDQDRERIERLARNTRGVHEIRSNLVVDPSYVRVREGSSANAHEFNAVASDITSQITASPNLKNYNLRVDSVGDSVTLSGEVSNERERVEAERIARNTRGVNYVRNEIVLARSTRNDVQINQDVKDALLRRNGAVLHDVDINTRDSIVTLRGWQRSNREIDRIVASARSVRGVRGVNNELLVR